MATSEMHGKHGASAEAHHRQPDLIPREYLRVIATWSLVPAYLAAGGFLGWAADRALDTFPFGVGIGLLLALGLAVRDMLRLRDEW